MFTPESLITLLLLVWIVYQDFRFRAVAWIIFPALLSVLLVSSALEQNIRYAMERLVLNSLFVLFQLILVYLYFRIRQVKFNVLLNNYIGPGDLVFFFAVAPAFPLYIFILYLSSGFLITILIYASIRLFDPKFVLNKHPIPLAGMLSLWFILFQVTICSFPDLLYSIDLHSTLLTAL